MNRRRTATHPATCGRQASADARRAAQQFWRLSDRELRQLIELASHADRLQLKVLVSAAAHDATCTALGVDFPRARRRRVFFLDTPDLMLERHGVVVRVRSNEREADDSVVKLRPVVPGDLPARLRRSERFVVEIDGMPGAYVCSGALKRCLGAGDVERAMAGNRPLRSLFSHRQLDLLAAHAPASVGIHDLTSFGPIDVRRAKVVPDGSDRALTAELWTYPDASRMLELSMRFSADQAIAAAVQMAAVMRASGLQQARSQTTKASTALSFFTGRPLAGQTAR